MSTPAKPELTELGGREPKPSRVGQAPGRPQYDLDSIADVMRLARDVVTGGKYRATLLSIDETMALAKLGTVLSDPAEAACALMHHSDAGADKKTMSALLRNLAEMTRPIMGEAA
jgi:hypothetical protein